MCKFQNVLLCVGLAIVMSGCGDRESAANLPQVPSGGVRDFDPSAAYRVSADDGRTAEVEATATAAGKSYMIDAMVGDINGRPIYASRVFTEVGEQQLQTLGQVKTRNEFRQEASFLLDAQLRSMVTNALVLAEAESRLSPQEQQGLQGLLRLERERVLAQFGLGSEQRAEEALQAEYGHGVDEELRRRREQLLIDKYLSETLHPRIHVTRQEVERYYADHYKEYNPPAQIVLRLIVVRDENVAKQVEAALVTGTGFAEVATQYSTVKQAEGGLMPAFVSQIDQFNELTWPAVNEAVKLLMVGQSSPRITIDRGWAWVYLENVESGAGKTLQDVYLEIEQRLRAQEYSALQRKYLVKLLDEGNYTPLDKMLAGLVEVASNRYASVD